MTSDRESAGPPPQKDAAIDGARVPVPSDQPPPQADAEGGEADAEDALPADHQGELSESDYARTTGSSPAATALIPAVKDEPTTGASEPVQSEEPSSPSTPSAEAAAHAEHSAHRAESPLESGRIAGLRLVHVEPYSVTQLAFVISVAMMIVSVVAVAIFWIMLAITGVWGQINDSVASLLSDDAGSFDIKDYLGFTRMVGGTLVLSGINVILMTALATIGAHLYNLAAALLGGVEATFSDE